ncbi:MAG TPA: hypothetical protein DCS07_16205 [Bdellovibrionales bacterium]|nr:MAG: hypothetical protein A2Z97_11000 [Bdellovibrionales bacterium GWB1_52_6]OFZ03513.1 MAG: hypothetical protein A2X97_06090 [Bdellovibrionales bacterium GWA1_52_35]OFZ33511.1 MAG: hypothetical protein A2070_08325 [Bdellovibrionales bacterium GWC1_52_8]HAR44148.1 hypothetical protein [Bdellovibrionales bacterium]HCM41100.1 hypothetical protein [Bdellovibrionales bacterium]
MATKTKTVAKNTTKLTNTTTNNTKTNGMTTWNVTQKDIAERAYVIYLSGKGGSQVDHWLQAETELRKQKPGQTANR